jgi:hypothetical protein
MHVVLALLLSVLAWWLATDGDAPEEMDPEARPADQPSNSLPGEGLTKVPTGWQYGPRDLAVDLVLDLGSDQPILDAGDEVHQYGTRIPKGK